MSYSSSVVSDTSISSVQSAPMQITNATRAAPSQPLAIIKNNNNNNGSNNNSNISSTALQQRRDSQSSAIFEFSSAIQHRRPSMERRPSAYVSDADLWGLDDVPYLQEPPAPPRTAQQWAMQQQMQRPILSMDRRRSSTTVRRTRPESAQKR